MIDNIINNFNFEKVLIVMQTLDWEWQINDKIKRVPTIKEMKDLASQNLQCVYDCLAKGCQTEYHSGSGGFLAYGFKEDGSIHLSLKFIIEEMESFEDVENLY